GSGAMTPGAGPHPGTLSPLPGPGPGRLVGVVALRVGVVHLPEEVEAQRGERGVVGGTFAGVELAPGGVGDAEEVRRVGDAVAGIDELLGGADAGGDLLWFFVAAHGSLEAHGVRAAGAGAVGGVALAQIPIGSVVVCVVGGGAIS